MIAFVCTYAASSASWRFPWRRMRCDVIIVRKHGPELCPLAGVSVVELRERCGELLERWVELWFDKLRATPCDGLRAFVPDHFEGRPIRRQQVKVKMADS